MSAQSEPVLNEVDTPRRHVVELLLNGEQISRASVVDVPTRIGTAEVRLGGIAGVFTAEPHRMKGYSARVLCRCIEWMINETDYDVSALFGIWHYYHRFGYAACMPAEPSFVLSVKSPVQPNRPMKVRTLRKADLPAVLRLYAAENATRTGSTIRRAKTWKGFPKGAAHKAEPTVVVAVDARDRVAGYIVHSCHDEGIVVAEAAGRDADACRALLAHCLRAAAQHGQERLRLNLPPDSAMADVCRAEGCEFSVGFYKNGGPMGRIIHQSQLLRKLEHEFARRIACSECAVWTGVIEIATDLGRDWLAVHRGRVHCVPPREDRQADILLRIPQQALTQLVFGYRRAAELLCAHRCRLSAAQINVVDALFPVGWAYTWWPDRY